MSALPSDDRDAFAARAAAFAGIHMGQATQALIANLHARVETIATDAGDLPVTVHDARAGDAWVCSPRTTYGECAAEEALRYLPGPVGRVGARLSGALGGALTGAGLDRAATLNNWLLSTNLYPPLRQVRVPALLREAAERWPGHALWLRSLNERHDADWLPALQAAGCLLVASRQVYLYDDLAPLVARHRDLKRDLSLLRRTPLHGCGNEGIVDADYARIAELYGLLYIGKYSRYNPLYGEAFLRRWHRAGLLELQGFRDDGGRLQCAVGLFRQGRTATAPIVGYGTAQPRSRGLYRLATACAYRTCLERGWRLNFSAGAAGFKRLRGGAPAIEYSALYVRHLPYRARLAAKALATATRAVGVPLLRRYRL